MMMLLLLLAIFNDAFASGCMTPSDRQVDKLLSIQQNIPIDECPVLDKYHHSFQNAIAFGARAVVTNYYDIPSNLDVCSYHSEKQELESLGVWNEEKVKDGVFKVLKKLKENKEFEKLDVEELVKEF